MQPLNGDDRGAWLDAVVVSHALTTTDIAVIDLAPLGGEEFPSYAAGAHVDVLIDSGMVRQYSLCGPPGTGRYRLAVLREPESRGGSRAMHALKDGDQLRISLPRNRFPLVSAQQHLLVAGGIGITPLLAMVYQLDSGGDDYVLHYCARSRTNAAFMAELSANSRVRFHFDDEDPRQKLDIAHDLGEPRPDVAVYVCGPAGFIDYVLGSAQELGWPTQALHYERFGDRIIRAEAGPRTDQGFMVRLAATGAEYFVPEGRSVLDVLLENGVDAPYSCQQGICGECVVQVLAGDPDHRDDVLSDDERAKGQFTTCVSRSRSSAMELDL
ncbi:PDR/VanB family oxidoreductase [Mycobacterium sp. 1245852.3]|uniref:PDR/VanB family oxidoreductase n=1 Tax=Mycobacterium sp. 1245852.3 TaxID=1856860 RepID=UPI001E3A840D|nr:PDR/VanB family oxidoreductase [Mycobacterium sp. 1245852.3]